jgi:hypothetical protein
MRITRAVHNASMRIIKAVQMHCQKLNTLAHLILPLGDPFQPRNQAISKKQHKPSRSLRSFSFLATLSNLRSLTFIHNPIYSKLLKAHFKPARNHERVVSQPARNQAASTVRTPTVRTPTVRTQQQSEPQQQYASTKKGYSSKVLT